MIRKLGPVFLITIVCVALVGAILAFWVAFLPRRAISQLDSAVQEITGLGVTSVGTSTLALDQGLAARFQDLVIGTNGYAQARLDEVSIPLTLTGKPDLSQALLIERGAITFDLAAGTADGKANLSQDTATSALQLQFSHTTFTFKDTARSFSAELSDASGNLTREPSGPLRLHVKGLLNGTFTTLHVEIESVGRVANGGSPADFLISSDNGELGFSGRLAWADTFGLDGRVSVASLKAASLLSWLGLPASLAPATGINLEGAYSQTAGKLRLPDLTIKLGPVEATGRLDLERLNGGLHIDGVLHSAELPLEDLWPRGTEADEWSPAPFKWQPLPAIAGTLQVNAQTLSIHDWRLSEAQALFSFKDDTANFGLTAEKGQLAIDAKLHSNGESQLSAKWANLAARETLTALTGSGWMTGKLSGQAELAATGVSPAELAGTLAGSISLEADGDVPGYSVKELLASGNKGWRSAPGDETKGLAFKLNGKVADGIINLTQGQLAAERTMYKLTGDIDILRRSLSVFVKAGSNATGVTVEGPLSEPQFANRSPTAPAQLPPAN